jgi:hypothetical protein
VDSFGCSESLVPTGKDVINPYEVHYANKTTKVEISGIGWGSDVQVMLLPTAGRPKGMPLWAIAQHWIGSDEPTPDGQLELLAYNARLLRTHGSDVLRGDFSVFAPARRLMRKSYKQALKDQTK